MSTYIVTPMGARTIYHAANHDVTDASTGFPSSETPDVDSFDSNTIMRVKELRADNNGGIVKATQVIVSNRNCLTSGLVTKDNLYNGQTNLVTFNPADSNSVAFRVVSGGAFIGDGIVTNSNISMSNMTATVALLSH